MSSNWTNIKEALPKEVERCKALMKDYADHGAAHTAAFYKIKMAVKRADTAISHNDLSGMTLAYTELSQIT